MDREKERQRDRGQYDKEKERRRDRGRYDRETEQRKDRGRCDRETEQRRDKGRYDRETEQRRDRGRYDREKERQRDRGRYDRERGGRHEDQLPRNYHRSASPRERSLRSRSSSGSRSPKLEKGKPNFSQSGLLAAETNTVKAADGTSTVLKYNEPPEARKPTLSWRLYVFKGSEQTGKPQIAPLTKPHSSLELLHIQRQSAYLIGRDRLVSDIAVDHPSCSKQHAAIQCRPWSSVMSDLSKGLLRSIHPREG